MLYKIVTQKYTDLVLNVQSYFMDKSNIIIYDKRNVIKIINYKNKKYVLKSFKIPHIVNKIVYKFFRESKAKRSYENSIKLLSLGVNTPKPIGYIEFPSSIFFMKSFYISEFFDYDFEIRAVFAEKNFKNREIILKLFLQFTYELHSKGVYHIDYSPGNILVKSINSNYSFFIIDVNRMQFLDFNVDLRMKSISKLTSDIHDNYLMVKEYAKISNFEESVLLDRLKFYLKEEQNYLDNKQKLKRIKNRLLNHSKQ